MGRNMIAGVVAAAAAGWLSLTYAREAMTRAPAPTAPSSPSAQGRPAPVDIVEGRAGWLYPGWDYLVDERPAETASAIEQIVKMAEANLADQQQMTAMMHQQAAFDFGPWGPGPWGPVGYWGPLGWGRPF